MGEHKVSVLGTSEGRKNFIDHLLKDLEALQKMLDNDICSDPADPLAPPTSVDWRKIPVHPFMPDTPVARKDLAGLTRCTGGRLAAADRC